MSNVCTTPPAGGEPEKDPSPLHRLTRLRRTAAHSRSRHNMVWHYAIECRRRGFPPQKAISIITEATKVFSRDVTSDIRAAVAKAYKREARPRAHGESGHAVCPADPDLMERVYDDAISSCVPLTPEQWRKRSPMPPPQRARDALGVLFEPDSLVWGGEAGASILKVRPLRELLDDPPTPFSLVAPCTFKARKGEKVDGTPSVTGRTKANVLDWKHVVVEFDDADTLEEQFARVLHIEDQTGVHLTAVVFSGGKSLHSWWSPEDDEHRQSLLELAARLGADPATFKPEQPVRCPAGKRLDRNPKPKTTDQEIYYWNPES